MIAMMYASPKIMLIILIMPHHSSDKEAPMPIYQCVPNFSEGRRTDVVEAIADVIRATPDAILADYSADPDHNRCVMSILGDVDAIYNAVLAAARVAVERIDLRTHQGVHPRVGAIDVLPVVPLRDTSLLEASVLAKFIGQTLGHELCLPVYFYEANARPDRPSALPELRRGGFEAFAHVPLNDERAPDCGPPLAHPSAGIAVVGARLPLVAYNINLAAPDVAIAQQTARQIRLERSRLPELNGVRALGLFLASQNRAQVSLNLTRPDQTPLPAVFHFVQEQAAKLGVTDLESEIIGLIPRASLAGLPPAAIHWHTYKPTQILEHWLEKS